MDLEAQSPLFTARHVHHSQIWILPGYSLPAFCLACATERLEDGAQASLHHRRILGEFQALLTAKSSPLVRVLSSDKRVLDHLSAVLFGLLVIQDASIVQLALEVLGVIASQFSACELPKRLLQMTIQTIMAAQSFPNCLSYLTFLGRLLHSIPSLCGYLIYSFGGFLEFILQVLAYPDEAVKSAVVYTLAQLSMKSPPNSLPPSLVQAVCGHVSSSLASAKSHNLTLNLLGLVKGLLKSSVYAQCLLQTDRHTSHTKGSTLASAFKRVLLSNDETLQLSGVQCVSQVLRQQPQYGQTLLQADIAEFMFEALTSKKDPLLLAIFSCLNSLATVDDFYSKGHIIYGIDQVISGVSASLETKKYDAVHHGLMFLGKVLQRQPTTMPVFSTANAKSLQKLMSVVHSALQTPSQPVVLSSVTTLSVLLCSRHLPAEFPLSSLLPLLSLLIHLMELHTTSPSASSSSVPSTAAIVSHNQTTMTAPNPQLLTAVFTIMDNMHRVCLEGKKNGQSVSRCIPSDSVTTFLSVVFEENILPTILLNAEAVDHPEPFSAVFSMAKMQLEALLEPSNSNTLAVKLAKSGFIHFAFDIKARFSTTPSGVTVCSCINSCVESLCSQLEPDAHRRTFIRDALHLALPDMNCELEKSLGLLLQKAPSSDCSVQRSSSTLSQRQRAVLVLFSLIAQHENEGLVPAVIVLQALDRFLSLNPDVHLLPAPCLTHLTALYAVSVHRASITSETATKGSHILVRALQRVPSPGSLFFNTPCLLQWAFAQPTLQPTARSWFWKWLQSTGGSSNDSQSDHHWSLVVQFVKRTSNVLNVLLDTSSEEPPPSLLSLFDHLLSEGTLDNDGSLKIFNYLQKILMAHRVQPLSDGTVASIMKRLTKSVQHLSVAPDIKLVYHGVILMWFSVGSTFSVRYYVLQRMSTHKNNTVLLTRVVSCVPTSSLPKDHDLVSASALRLIACIIHHQYKNKMDCLNQSGGVITIQSVLATLLHHSVAVVVSGLYFWRTVISSGAYTGCFSLCDPARKLTLDSDKQTLKKLSFLLQNCLVKDDETVRQECALCLAEFIRYLSATSRDVLDAAVWTWNTVILDHVSTIAVHSHIPAYYLPCLAAIIQQVNPAYSGHLKHIAQLLYESIVTQQNRANRSQDEYALCFNAIEKVDKNLLDTNQWTHLNQTLSQT